MCFHSCLSKYVAGCTVCFSKSISTTALRVLQLVSCIFFHLVATPLLYKLPLVFLGVPSYLEHCTCILPQTFRANDFPFSPETEAEFGVRSRTSSENMTLIIWSLESKVTPQIVELEKRPISCKTSIILG